MNGLEMALLGAAGATAAVDWWSIRSGRRRVEYITKPLTMVLLIAAAIATAVTDSSVQAWFIAALASSLAGDVFLMLVPVRFVAGLASFFLAHVSYIVAFGQVGQSDLPATLAAAAMIVLAVTLGRKVRTGATAADSRLGLPVALYIIVVSVMVIRAAGTDSILALAGAALFYASDGVNGWNRFVVPLPHGRLLTRVLYHGGQGLLVLSLTRF